MNNLTLFEMRGRFRQSIIHGYKFYVDQASSRLLSQFQNINEDADKAAEAWLEAQLSNFDPDRHDPGDFCECANEVGIEFYQLLDDMHEWTRLSVVAGIYHEWDKQFRQWTCEEIKHWYRGENVLAKVWTVDFGKLAELFASLGWDIREKLLFKIKCMSSCGQCV